MAHIKRLVSKSTGKISFRAVIRVDGKQLTKTRKRKSEVVEWARKLEGNPALASTLIDPVLNLAVETAINQFMPWLDKMSNKYRDTRTRLLNLTNSISHLKLNQIKKSHLIDCRDALTITDSTKNRHMNDWGTFCKWVTSRIDGVYQPQKGIVKLTEPDGRRDYLSNEQQLNLLEQAKIVDYHTSWKKLYLITLMALTTGARKGELMALQWRDIQWRESIAIIRAEATGASKTGYREVPLPPLVIKELLQHRKFQGLIFCSNLDDTTPFRFKKQWNLCRINADLPDFVFHSLRHTAASNMAKAGKSLLQIGVILGHRSAQTSLRYSHLVEREQLHSITADAVAHLG